MALLFLSTPERGAVWKQVFDAAQEPVLLGAGAVTDPADVTHIVCWTPPADFGQWPNLRMVLSTGAGVDQMPPLPDGVALVRTLAPGIEQMVRDWVVMATLALHRDLPGYIAQARAGLWKPWPVLAARERRVGVMGMGRTGRLAAQSLAGLGFDVAGYSRSGAPVDDFKVYGADRMDAFLARSDILICLLPLTAQTRGLMTDAFFARLPDGARLVHAGRGAQLDMAALMRALDSGQLSAAMLDATDPEPLPTDHPAWSDPRVLITPHVASITDAREGAMHALRVLRAEREGKEIPGLVDQTRGY